MKLDEVMKDVPIGAAINLEASRFGYSFSPYFTIVKMNEQFNSSKTVHKNDFLVYIGKKNDHYYFFCKNCILRRSSDNYLDWFIVIL